MFSWQHKAGGNEVEQLHTKLTLHSLDVQVQAVFAGQFRGSENKREFEEKIHTGTQFYNESEETRRHKHNCEPFADQLPTVVLNHTHVLLKTAWNLEVNSDDLQVRSANIEFKWDKLTAFKYDN